MSILTKEFSTLVDAKLNDTLITKDSLIFNTNYEGSATSGAVTIPIRDTEVEVKSYNKTSGTTLSASGTSYKTLTMDYDEAVNELIDGYDPASLPDNVIAERLSSAGYTLALSMDKKSINALETVDDATISDVVTASTTSTAYANIVKARTALSRLGVPTADRFIIVSPEFMELIIQDESFIRQGELSQELVSNGVVGKIAGFNVFESNNLMFEDEDFVEDSTITTEFICGHSNWCHRVSEWAVPVAINPISDGVHIGACAVQGRKIYNVYISKPETVYIKRIVE